MDSRNHDIAVIGMACIYPGAKNKEEFWNNVVYKLDAVSVAPENRLLNQVVVPESIVGQKMKPSKGGFIGDCAHFNPAEFGIMPNSIDGSDPAHFLALRLAHEVVADAGYACKAFDRKRTAVILGHGNYMPISHVNVIQHSLVVNQVMEILREINHGVSDTHLETMERELRASLPPLTPDNCPGAVPNLLTSRISNRLDLQGPSYTVDAACAASLIALDAGIHELRCDRCDLAIIGGVQVPTNVLVYTVFSLLGALSPTGWIRPFDKKADGTLLGEGVGMMMIKRREDAERDGDRIYCLIKGVGVSSDGRGQGILVPRIEGQLLALERGYEAGNVSPGTVGLLEAHGTGTQVGDVAEIKALTRFFGTRNGGFPHCALGSIKSMIGHSIPAAGMAGLIKTAFALYHKILPPTLCDEPNPELGLDESPFYLNTKTRPWIFQKGKPRRAGVSAFGFGGINAHAVMEEYTGCKIDRTS